MRLIDADVLYKAFEEVYNESDRSLSDAVWWFFGKLEETPTITPPPNAPLTLEELREMDGEPVWVKFAPYGYWAIIYNGWAKFGDGDSIPLDRIAGRAYHRRPEEETV